ncbi:flagellar M-ring protein FliF [Vibrio vulnificus]|nr:flagellar M-ring protein FliF [Vibrio vulnificus]
MELDKKGKIIFTVGTVLILACAVFVYFTIFNKEYQRAYSDLTLAQLANVVTELENGGIEFHYPETGEGILIEKSQLNRARVLLEKQAVFAQGSIGLEIFDKQQNTMSDFYQKINYQRAIQGELEKTLTNIQGVESARVHIAFPKEKAFYKEKSPVKAAVTLTFKQENTPNRNAIVITAKRLLSRSIPGLIERNVDVLDSSGRAVDLLGEQSGMSFFNIKNEVEQSIEGKVKQLLSPYIDISLIGVSAWVKVNNDRVKEVTEGLNSASDPVVVKRTTETRNQTRKNPASEVLSEEFRYQNLTKEVEYHQGRLESMSVSVIVPETDLLSLESLQNLLSSGLGIDKSRGDSLSVAMIPLNIKPDVEQIPEPSSANALKELDQTQQHLWRVIMFVVTIAALSLIYAVKTKIDSRNKLLSKQEQADIIKELQVWVNEK